MSNWTHVAGIMRLDSIRGITSQPNFEKMIGMECLWSSGESVHDDAWEHKDAYLPMGSEGSLQKTVWTNPEPEYVFSYVVSIFGDLRDHDSAQEIIDWFQNKCSEVENYGCYVRDAVITAANEMFGTMTWTYEENE